MFLKCRMLHISGTKNGHNMLYLQGVTMLTARDPSVKTINMWLITS